MEKLTYRLPWLIFYYPSDKQEALCSSAPSSTPVTPISTSSLQYCNSPAKVTKSTTRRHYWLWQGMQDPNQDLNGVPNAQIFSNYMKPSSQRLCFIFLPFSFGLLMWMSTKKQGSCITEDFLEALTERMGLHYCNEATGMAATLPSFMPSQPALPSGNTLFTL